ncbi:MAG: hypothetical protein IJN29_00380, partial [Akkermansia sp.]|nr:hypothetical protein [Akkermansia sp.]
AEAAHAAEISLNHVVMKFHRSDFTDDTDGDFTARPSGAHLKKRPRLPPRGIFHIFHCSLCISWHFNSPAISDMKFPQNGALFTFVIFLVVTYSEHTSFCSLFSPLLRNLTPPCAKKSAFWATLGLHIAFEMRYTAR